MALNIPTMQQVQAVRRASQKVPAVKAKLARSVAKTKADREDERKLQAWATSVKDRDEWKDVYTGRPVKRARDVGVIHPQSAHAHHIASRDDLAVRYDRRNGVTLSYESHARVEANELRIVGTRFFIVKGKRYINGDHLVRFVEVK